MRGDRRARDLLQDGLITLSSAAELQSAFDRQKRGAGLMTRSVVAGPKPASPRPGSKPPTDAAPKLVLDAAGRKKLVEDAAGKSARQVKQMLAELDPHMAVPADRVRPLSGERWELKAVVDDECRLGLDQLKGLLSHVDPHMTLGQLVGRLVKEGLDRHDPSRPPRGRPTGSRPAGAESTSTSKSEAKSDGSTPTAAKPSVPPPDTGTSPAKAVPKPARRAASTSKPVAAHATPPKERVPTNRTIPASVKRQVWEREEGHCRFVDPQTGRRCSSRHLLQIDHIRPFALGGAAEPGNLRLLCFAHHRYRHERRGSPHEPPVRPSSAPERPGPSPTVGSAYRTGPAPIHSGRERSGKPDCP